MPRQKRIVVTGNASSRRVADFRARTARLDATIPLAMAATLDDLASLFDCHKSEVVRCLLRYALTNRDWRSQGLIWRDC